MITNFSLFENQDWNKVLHDATWTQKKIGKEKWYMDFDKIKLAIENGADVDICYTLEWAVKMNDFKIVKYMLEHGADPNLTNDSTGWNPLMCACALSDIDVDIAKILIDYGADPFLGNFQGTTAMDTVSPKSNCKFASFGYECASKEIREKRDEIRKYIEQSTRVVAKKYNL